MNLNSKNYPDITYEQGEEIFLPPDEANLPFYFDVEEELTKDSETMALVAEALDNTDILENKAKKFLKDILSDKDSEYYDSVKYFMEFHKEDLDSETLAQLFPLEDISKLTFTDMVDYLKIKRFGSLIDMDWEEQVFIMDLSFNEDFTDELMVIYFNLEKDIICVTHES